MQHELKTWPDYFEAHTNGELPSTLRRNDRNFKAGDTILMREFKPDAETENPTGVYTGREAKFVVNRAFCRLPGLAPDYALLILRPLVER